ncbi:MAG: hypothetical protein H3Z54_05905 [archaeon]|nr:hypothetical protein [archaeon]
MLQNKKITSIAIISLFILSAFTTVPLSFALPYISVYPSSVRPGDTVRVSGYYFPAYKNVDIYIDFQDDYHKLGRVVTRSDGSFTFTFTMQSSKPGTHTIIAVNPPATYTAVLTLQYTNPLDQRLIDLINGLATGVGDIEDKIDDIEAKLDDIVIPKLDTILSRIGVFPTANYGSLASFVEDMRTKLIDIKTEIGTWPTTHFTDMSIFADWLFGELISDIAATGHLGWTDLASALDDIKDEIITIDGIVDNIWGKVDDLDSWFGTGGTYSKTAQIIVGEGLETLTTDAIVEEFSLPGGKPFKVTITITAYFVGPDEEVTFNYSGAKESKTVASGLDGEATFEVCTDWWEIYATCFGPLGFDGQIEYTYVIEYQP